MPIAPEITESVASVNLKNLADAPAFYQALAMGNAVSHQQIANSNALSHQQAMNAIVTAGVGAIINQMTSVDPSQAMSEVKLLQSDLAEKLAQMGAALSAVEAMIGSVAPFIQGMAKTVGTQPPVTIFSPGKDVGGKET